MNKQTECPTNQSARFNHLDILRGFALLGILLMNMQSFAMPGAAYLNPTAWGDFQGVNQIVWIFSHVFADAKFMGLFSILFGAGICLFAERAMEKTGRAAALHYKRNFWLLVFGLIHAHFIWYGDILVSYALCAFGVYWFRKRSPRFLTISAVILLAVASLYSLFVHFALNNNYIPQDGLNDILKFWQPDADVLRKEINAYQGNPVAQFQQRSADALFFETQLFLTTFLWRASGMMLLGMALYKSGILLGKRSNKFYLVLAVVGCGIGLSLSSYGVVKNFENNFALNYSMFWGSQFNYWGSVFTCLGYIGVINLMLAKSLLKGLQRRLASVGQMAFSNYIFHSVFCTFIFYGHGLGLFGAVERWQQLVIVLLVWVLQLWYSPLWLNKYRFGPLEWAWRSLTYGCRQPFKR